MVRQVLLSRLQSKTSISSVVELLSAALVNAAAPAGFVIGLLQIQRKLQVLTLGCVDGRSGLYVGWQQAVCRVSAAECVDGSSGLYVGWQRAVCRVAAGCM